MRTKLTQVRGLNAGFGVLTRFAEHRPEGRDVADFELLDELERVARVVREVVFLLRFEVRRDALGVAAFEHRRERGAAGTRALVERIGSEDSEVVVRLVD